VEEGKGAGGGDSHVRTEEDRKKETLYRRDTAGEWTAIQTHEDAQWLHTTVGIQAALCQYIIIPEQEQPPSCGLYNAVSAKAHQDRLEWVEIVIKYKYIIQRF